MRLRVREALGAVVVTVVALAAAAIALASLWGCSATVSADASGWPESAEFSTLETGQGRFSAHGTNLDYWYVIVDHETGAQYLCRLKYGITPLLDADGTPLLVLEAGE